MVGRCSAETRSAGPPALWIARRMTSTVSQMQRAARGWGLKTTALRPLTEIMALNMTVEVGLVVGITPATTPTGVATSHRPVRSSCLRKPTVGSSLIDSQTPSEPKRFLSTL